MKLNFELKFLLAAINLFPFSMGLVLPRSNSVLSCTGTSASECNDLFWTLCSSGGEIVMPAPAKWRNSDCTPAHCTCIDPYAPTTSAQETPLPTAALIAMRAVDSDGTEVNTHTHHHTRTATFRAHTRTHTGTHTHHHTVEAVSTETLATSTYNGVLHTGTRTHEHTHDATAHPHTHTGSHTRHHSPTATSHTEMAATSTYDGDLHFATSTLDV